MVGFLLSNDSMSVRHLTLIGVDHTGDRFTTIDELLGRCLTLWPFFAFPTQRRRFQSRAATK
jgi:hypothetical protein